MKPKVKVIGRIIKSSNPAWEASQQRQTDNLGKQFNAVLKKLEEMLGK